jgi:hypothetical protein
MAGNNNTNGQNRGKGNMSVHDAGVKGGQKVRRLVQEGEELEGGQNPNT